MNNSEINEEILWIWMTKLGKPMNKAIDLVFEKFGSPENAWKADKSEAEEKNDTPVFYERLFDESIKEKAVKIYNEAKEKGIRIITRNSEIYPENLLEIYNPPPLLYCKGKLPAEISEEMVLLSVVGSRACTSYGRNMTYRICSEIAKCGVGIVSGLARGIDACAHLAAIDTGGYTVAVLGGGVDVIYPAEHRKIYDKISETGCLISEYPPGTAPLRNYFPARNRIIAGMSFGTFVTEAGKSSGAMITVDRALEEGRDVFALPGNIDSSASEGTNMLLRKGAICVTSAYDILEEISFGEKFDDMAWKNGKPDVNFLSEKERKVIELLESGCSRPENRGESVGLLPGEMASVLTRLELKGIIEKVPSGTWILKKFFTT